MCIRDSLYAFCHCAEGDGHDLAGLSEAEAFHPDAYHGRCVGDTSIFLTGNLHPILYNVTMERSINRLIEQSHRKEQLLFSVTSGI